MFVNHTLSITDNNELSIPSLLKAELREVPNTDVDAGISELC